MCVCEGGYIEKCLGLVVQYGQLKFCTGWSHREVVVWGGEGWTRQMLSNGQLRGQED